MKAVRYDAPADFAVTDVPMPSVGPRDVRIKIHQAGVCGTDLHLHHGTYIGTYPLTPGHEMVGEIDEAGADVTRFQPGQRVTVNPNIYCGECDHCLAGRLNLCLHAQALGVTLPGFFAEYVTVDHRQVFSVDGLDLDTAVLVEPTACAVHGVETLDIRPGSHALVIGAGPTGTLLAQLIAGGGAASVTVADIVPFKLDTVSRLGVDHTIHLAGNADDAEKLRDASPTGDGYDMVVEATGVTAVGTMCLPLTRSGGTLLIYGVPRATERLAISPFDVFRREITIKGSYAEMTSFGGKALDTLASDPTAHKVIVVP
jgi:D-arabinitol dehydrogenase (NADP+)